MFVEDAGRSFGIPASRIERIEIGTRRGPERLLAGTLIGGGIGALAGGLLGLAAGDDTSPCEGATGICFDLFHFSAEEKAVMGAITLGMAGGGVGFMIGTLSPWSWSEATVDELEVRAAPTPGGLSIQVSVRPPRIARAAP